MESKFAGYWLAHCEGFRGDSHAGGAGVRRRGMPRPVDQRRRPSLLGQAPLRARGMSTRAGGSAWPRHYWKNSSAFSTLSVRSPADDPSSLPTGSGRKTGAAYPLANPPVGSALNQLWVARGDMTAPDDKDAIGI